MPRPVGRPLRLLISFSPQDQELKDQLVQHLQGLVRFAGIELWAADRVRAGNDWQQEAERAFENADVALLLISSDFLASSALHDVDLRRLFARHEQGGVTVIPVILRWCYWEVHPWLRQLKPLPGSQQPVESFGKEGRDQVLTEVAKEIARRAGVLPEIATVKAEPVLDEASAMSPARPSPTPAIHPRRPMPNFPDEQTRYLSEQLASAKVRKSKLVEHDRDTSGIDREILNLKRQLREGGRLRAGDSLGDKDRYQLLDLLGRGGFASVWLARDTVRRCDVAIKVLHGNLAGDRIRVDRFKRGARIMSELEHEAVVRVLQPYGMEDGWHYFVMEYMSGGDLHQAVLKGRIGTGHAILAILRATEGLAEAHARGIVHRDVKPANILLDANVEAKLADFDLVLARDTTGGTRTGGLGTAVYSSPELMDLSTENDDSTELDPRPDVYGLGMTTVFAISRKDLPTNLIGNVERARFIEELECSEAIKAVLRRATTVAGPPAMYPDATAFHEALLDAILASTRQITATWPDSSALLSSRPIPGTAGRPHGSIPATSGQAPSSGTPRITVTTLDGGSSSGELD
ncbi:MAG: protein kinase, partial [Byssovorax sp.]